MCVCINRKLVKAVPAYMEMYIVILGKFRNPVYLCWVQVENLEFARTSPKLVFQPGSFNLNPKFLQKKL